MSRRRDLRLRSHSHYSTVQFNQSKLRHPSLVEAKNSKSRSAYIPCPKIKSNVNLSENVKKQEQLEKVYNRNISMFRQSLKASDVTQLPFMSSLRSQICESTREKRTSTICQPFSAGEKPTINLKTRKRVSDLEGLGTRMSNAYYRWHHKTGVLNKQSTFFECSLREYESERGQNPERSFHNFVKPIHYAQVEESKYTLDELTCQKQKTLFKIKGCEHRGMQK